MFALMSESRAVWPEDYKACSRDQKSLTTISGMALAFVGRDVAALVLAVRVPARAKQLRLFAASLLVGAPSVQALILIQRDGTVAIAALVSLGLAAAGARFASGTGARGLALALSIPAALWATASVATAIGHADLLSSIWVYVLLALLGLVARFAASRGARSAARLLASTALGLLALAPSVQALVFRDRIAVVAGVSLGGLLLVGYAARQSGLSRERERAAIAIGLAAATLSPSILALLACMGHAAADLDGPAHFRGAGRWVYLAGCALVSALLFGLALGSSSLRREHRRFVELGAVATGAGVAFLLSLPVARDDLFYSSMALAFGGAALAVALLRFRLILAVAGAALTLLVLCIQYFAKLAAALHWGLLAVGFGLLVLFAATLYERKLKQLLPDFERWE